MPMKRLDFGGDQNLD